MSNAFDGLIGKTVARVEFVNTEQDVLTLYFTDGSMLVACEGTPDVPEATWHGLDVCASINEEDV